jgi:hypothetical protein
VPLEGDDATIRALSLWAPTSYADDSDALGGVAPWVPFLYFAAGAVVSRLWAAGRERAIGVGDGALLYTSGTFAATNGGRSGQIGSPQKRRSHNHQTPYKPVCLSSHSLFGD